MANSHGDEIAFATPRSSTCILLNCILFVTVLDFCCVSIGDLTRDCLGFPLATMSVFPSYFYWKIEEKIEPKEISSCLIPRLLVVFIPGNLKF